MNLTQALVIAQTYTDPLIMTISLLLVWAAFFMVTFDSTVASGFFIPSLIGQMLVVLIITMWLGYSHHDPENYLAGTCFEETHRDIFLAKEARNELSLNIKNLQEEINLLKLNNESTELKEKEVTSLKKELTEIKQVPDTLKEYYIIVSADDRSNITYSTAKNKYFKNYRITPRDSKWIDCSPELLVKLKTP